MGLWDVFYYHDTKPWPCLDGQKIARPSRRVEAEPSTGALTRENQKREMMALEVPPMTCSMLLPDSP